MTRMTPANNVFALDNPGVGPAQVMLPFVRMLRRYADLAEVDMAFLDRTLGDRIVRVEPGRDLVQKGDKPVHAFLVLDGWAYRYKVVPNRGRQIVAFLLPGDLSDLNVFLLREMDHSIACLTAVTVAKLSSVEFDLLFGPEYPQIARALAIKALADVAVQREWTVNLGQRSAPERIGHILCELFHRLRAVGLTEGNRCFLPLTQSDLAEATGLSLVHVNKRLRDLRGAGLIQIRGKILTIPDLAALERLALFNPDYLNLHDKAAP